MGMFLILVISKISSYWSQVNGNVRWPIPIHWLRVWKEFKHQITSHRGRRRPTTDAENWKEFVAVWTHSNLSSLSIDVSVSFTFSQHIAIFWLSRDITATQDSFSLWAPTGGLGRWNSLARQVISAPYPLRGRPSPSLNVHVRGTVRDRVRQRWLSALKSEPREHLDWFSHRFQWVEATSSAINYRGPGLWIECGIQLFYNWLPNLHCRTADSSEVKELEKCLSSVDDGSQWETRSIVSSARFGVLQTFQSNMFEFLPAQMCCISFLLLIMLDLCLICWQFVRSFSNSLGATLRVHHERPVVHGHKVQRLQRAW